MHDSHLYHTIFMTCWWCYNKQYVSTTLSTMVNNSVKKWMKRLMNITLSRTTMLFTKCWCYCSPTSRTWGMDYNKQANNEVMMFMSFMFHPSGNCLENHHIWHLTSGHLDNRLCLKFKPLHAFREDLKTQHFHPFKREKNPAHNSRIFRTNLSDSYTNGHSF